MITKKWFVAVFLWAFISVQPLAVSVLADEVDMQEKYGYTLVDVPNEVKNDYFEDAGKKWEDSVYSERLLFLQKWEVKEQKEQFRKDRLKAEIDRQKQQEDLKAQKKNLDKQQKNIKDSTQQRLKELEKEKEKLRLSKKHKSMFKKMDDLRNKQMQRNQGQQ